MQPLLNDIPIFLLVFVRVASFFSLAPIFSYKTIPNPFKIGIAFFISLIIMTTIQVAPLQIDMFYFLLILKEALVGLSFGFIAGLIFYAIQSAGALIDIQMGFAIANVIDPQTKTSSPLSGQFFYVIALLFLLSVNGHYLLLDGIFYSYQILPVNQLNIHFDNGALALNVVNLFTKMFVVALQMAAPIVGSLFLVDVGLGIIARTVPQVNVFVVGLPLKIMIALIIMFIIVPVYIMIVRQMMNGLDQTLKTFLQLLNGG